MHSLAVRFHQRYGSFSFAGLMLVTLLQRTPLVRLMMMADSLWLRVSLGHVLRSSALAATALGVVDTLAGATTFTATPGSPASATVGASFSAAFAVTGATTPPGSYTVSGLPPGLSVPGSTAHGSGEVLLNGTSGTITGTPTTAGSFVVDITAWQNSGATGDSIPNTYTINVSGGGGGATAPSISAQPANVSVTAGQAASFSVTANGTAPLSYQWRKDGNNIGGATSSTFSINSTATGDAGTYSVVVSNSAGSVTSNGATLTVNAAATAPSISAQPANVSVTAGQAASFSVTASGTAPLGYQWRKDGNNIGGATSSTFSINSTATGDAGTYSVVVSNSAGSATSNGATLTVTAAATAPSITTQPANVSVTAGQPASFSVTASGTAPLSYQWRKDGNNIGAATSSTFSINSTATGDAGTYSVVVSNSAGSVTSSGATLTVTAAATAPSITTQPANVSVTAGQPASFSVTANGTAPLSYQWRKDGNNLGGATSSTFSINSTVTGDAGNYSVVVSNSAGSVTSNDASLTVGAGTPPPTITTQPTNQTVTAGHAVTFTAAASGGSGQWQSSTNGTTWTNLNNDSTYNGVTTGTLTVSNTTTGMNGLNYRFTATNTGGTANSNAAILSVLAVIFPSPMGVGLDSAGNLYVADSANNNIHKVTTALAATRLAGGTSAAGSTDGAGSTAALFNTPGSLVVDAAGIIFVADTANATIRRIATDGTVTTFAGSATGRGNTDGTGTAATFSSTSAIALDSTGNLFVADGIQHTVRKLTAGAVVTTLAGSAGNLGNTDGTGTAARFNHPTGVVADAAGNVYVADTTNNTIRKVTAAGGVTTLAGVAGVSGATDGTGGAALFNGPAGLAIDGAGNIYVADSGNSAIRKVTPAGAVTTLAGLSTIAGLLDGTGSGAWFNQPKGVAVDGAGNVYVADTGNAAIRKITPAGAVTTLAITLASTPNPTPTPTPTPTPNPGGSGGGGGGGGGGAPSLWFVGALALLGAGRRMRSPVAR
ncbi:MAG TPA: immunoglobulin domain-containing protein [Lacunisphaera sp.]|nr:immunoglobulin domain-containing protein [Lacunisphaera sp.]